ncbi:rhomboid family intramembrane serine protease [Bacillus horti]|uniref:Membrane associated rhomboid family serine protease n=1 Tax=Caldalkalibacillus horti TaxID=77523 RepID=A0ABT9W4R5_9BACI|nr:rhomboid family intramembrane serine protease [Bacillus horti]MDQ0168248.1 membrane associated rhomboid family serine protease [Bacillus horti]
MFIRNERSIKEFMRLYPIVSWIVMINTAIFLLIQVLPFNTIMLWGLGYNGLIAQGEYWRILTPIFMHASVGHFVFNTFSLIIFGPALERILNKFKFTIIYLLTGIIGNIGTFVFEGPTYSHLGASGAIYGLLGVYFFMRFLRKDLIDPGSAQIVIIILIIGAAYTVISPTINLLAHLFGFVGGALLAPLFLPKERRRYL